GMATAGGCHAKKCVPVFGVRRWKSNEDWMARTGYVSAVAISGCAIAQHPCDRPQVLPAYGLQDLRNEHQDPKTKSNPNTMCLLITPGGNRGTGHFYLAKNRTFLLCVDRIRVGFRAGSLSSGPSAPPCTSLLMGGQSGLWSTAASTPIVATQRALDL